MAPSKQRWLVALCTVAVQLSIGSVYAYSVLKAPLAERFGWSSQQTSLAFSLAIAFLGASAALLGPFVERRGPRVAAATSALLFTGGLALSALAVGPLPLPQVGGVSLRLVLFYLGYGVVGGVGLGIGYIAPVGTLVRWFPDRRGLATGLSVMGFGAGALLASPLALRLTGALGVSGALLAMAGGYLVLMLAGAAGLARPPEGWAPGAAARTAVAAGATAPALQLSAPEARRTARFWMLWVMMFVNISAGLVVLSVAAPLAQAQVGMTPLGAAALVGLLGAFNGGGRIGWASLSDYTGRANLYVLFFAVQACAFVLLPRLSAPLPFQLALFLVLSMYGGGFALLPAFVGDLFGTRQLSAILGLLLTSWSAAGLVGPQLVAWVRDTTGGYTLAFHLLAGLLAVGLAVALTLKLHVRGLGAAPARPVAAPAPARG